MASAAIETVQGIRPEPNLPKSISWQLIESYYSAFFAAHAILRMFGWTCSQLEREQLDSIHEIAELFGQRAGVTLKGGQYAGTIDTASRTITLKKRSGGDGGSHGAMWGLFVLLLRHLSEALLKSPTAGGAAQQGAAKLFELEQVLTANGGNKGGSWLSQVRNRANYQMAYGAWFPYAERQKYYDALTVVTDLWLRDPMDIQLWSQRGRDLQRFLEANMMIVALCRVLTLDMAARCPKGTSFHGYGAVALLKRIRGGPV